AEDGLVIAEEIPGDAHARLVALVVGIDQRARESGLAGLVGLNQTAQWVLAVIPAQNKVTDAIIIRVGRGIPRPPHTQCEGDPWMDLPGVVPVKLDVMPAAQVGLLVIEFRIFGDWQVFEEQFGNQIPGSIITGLDGVKPAAAVRLLVLDVVAEKPAELEAVAARQLRETIFPDPEVLVILPGRLVPQRGIAIRSPPHSRKARPFDPWEDGWELG